MFILFAYRDMTSSFVTNPFSPSWDFSGTGNVMIAAIRDGILFAGIFIDVPAGCALRWLARVFLARSGFPAFHLCGAFKTMIAAVLEAIFFANVIVSVLVWFAGRRAASSLVAGLGVLSGFIVFAEFIGAAVLVGRHGIDAEAIAFDESLCLTRRFRTLTVTTGT